MLPKVAIFSQKNTPERCGDVKMWKCGDVKMWRCGDVEMWRCGDVRHADNAD
jgi:predicted RNA-binding Zn-ribbon protein involved in translation (DUF1610 family)